MTWINDTYRRFTPGMAFCLFLILLSASPLQAINLWYVGNPGLGSFNDPGNWSTTDPTSLITPAVSPPTAQDDIYFVDSSFKAVADYEINISGTQNVRGIYFQGLGRATLVEVTGTGYLNHYGDWFMPGSPVLDFDYRGRITEQFNPAFSPKNRVFDHHGQQIQRSSIDVLIDEDDTLTIASRTNLYYFSVYNGVVSLEDTLGAIGISFSAYPPFGSEKVSFLGNGEVIFPLLRFGFSGPDSLFGTIDVDSSRIVARPNYGISLGNTTDIPIDLFEVDVMDSTGYYRLNWKTGKVKQMRTGSLNLAMFDGVVDSLEILDPGRSNNGSERTLKFKSLITSSVSCEDYHEFNSYNFWWLGTGVPFGTDTLAGFALQNCSNRDSLGNLFTGANRTTILNGKDHRLNQGFEFVTDLTPRDMFWIAGWGDWHDITNWSLSSGGPPLTQGDCPPRHIDNVYFDANSFYWLNQYITINGAAECHDMIWQGLIPSGINIQGNQMRFNLYGSMRLDSNMADVINVSGDLVMWGQEDSIWFGENSLTAPKIRYVDLWPQVACHYDLLGYGEVRYITYFIPTNSPYTYVSLPDTFISGRPYNSVAHPNFADTLDMRPRSTQWFPRPSSQEWTYNNPSPAIIHDSTCWFLIEGIFELWAINSDNCYLGRYPNTSILPGAILEIGGLPYKCMDFTIRGTGRNGTQSSYTLINTGSNPQGIDCINFRVEDTIVQEVRLGMGQTVLDITDSLTIERRGDCNNKHIFGSAGGTVSRINMQDKTKYRLEGTEIQNLNYIGNNPPWDVGVQNYDGGGNVNIIFGPGSTGNTYYWRRNPITNSYSGDWDQPDNWTLNPLAVDGQGSNGCPPTLNDSLIFDAASTGTVLDTVNGTGGLACRAFMADNAQSNLTFVGAGQLFIGGTFRLNDDLNWQHRGDMVADFDGPRDWAFGDQDSLGGNLSFIGDGTLRLRYPSTKRWYQSGRWDHRSDGMIDADSIPYISVYAWHAQGEDDKVTNCDSMEIRGRYNHTSIYPAAIRVQNFDGTNSRLFLTDDSQGNTMNPGNFQFMRWKGGLFFGNFNCDTLIIEETARISGGHQIGYFLAPFNNPNAGIIWESSNQFTGTYTSYPNSYFYRSNTFNILQLQSDRTHTFDYTQTFSPTGDLVKIGDLSKVINFRSRNPGTPTTFTKPTGGNIFICNIDAKDVIADSTANGPWFKTNTVSVLNDAPGWIVQAPGTVNNVARWNENERILFRNDSTRISFSYDSTAIGPTRMVFTQTPVGTTDSIQLNDGVYMASIRVGGFRDTNLVAPSIPKHFECPGIFVVDSMDALQDTVILNVPETENGLSLDSCGSNYFYKNLYARVYLMDTVNFLTTGAIYDRSSPTDTDSLKWVQSWVRVHPAVIVTDSMYIAQRVVAMLPENPGPASVRLFLTAAEIDSLRWRSGYTGSISDLASQLVVQQNLYTDTGYSVLHALNPTTHGIATEINPNTYYFDIDVQDSTWGRYFFAIPRFDPLPITYFSFDVYRRDRSALLDWNVEATGISHFEVLHRNEDGLFTLLDRVAASTTATGVINYEYLHPNPATGDNYYQIITLDQEGDRTNSVVRVLNFEAEEPLVSIFPNPVDGMLTIQVEGEVANSVELQLVGMEGKVLREEQHPSDEFPGVVRLDLSDLPAGVYFLQFKSGESREVWPVVKIH